MARVAWELHTDGPELRAKVLVAAPALWEREAKVQLLLARFAYLVLMVNIPLWYSGDQGSIP